MKAQKLFMFVATLFALAACSDGDEGGGNEPKTNPTTPSSVNNNKNISGPAEAQSRLEFPKLKDDNSVVVVHRAVLNGKTNEEGVNYCVEWDTGLNSQRWSCYQLYSSISYNTASNVLRYSAENTGTLLSTCQYPNDPDLPVQYRWAEDPYKFSGYDHGHICPSADRLRAVECNYQTFYITNMQPQYNKFNAGLWQKMEEDVRNWVRLGDTLYVCKGGTIDNPDYILEYVNRNSHQSTRVNKDHIPVPRFFYMAVVCRKGDEWHGMAYWAQQYNEDHSNDNRKGYAITIDRLEELTGIDFFCNLPDDIEAQVESEKDYSFWGLK
jgi:endonuclease G